MSDHTTTPRAAPTEEHLLIGSRADRYVFAVTRISIGWVFLWAFFDKLLGLGFATPTEAAGINGGNPTEGFLANAVSGPFAGAFNSIAGVFWADPLSMVGLLGIGAALVLVGLACVRSAALSAWAVGGAPPPWSAGSPSCGDPSSRPAVGAGRAPGVRARGTHPLFRVRVPGPVSGPGR